jgi:hypothetical protein
METFALRRRRILRAKEEGNNVKLLRMYSAEQSVQQRISSARSLPGFRDEPECFWYAEYEVDEDLWTSGYLPRSPNFPL